MKRLKQWLLRGVVALAIGFVAVYAGDWAIFKLRGSPQSKVSVNRFLNIPLKGNKTEFDYVGTMDVPCSISLFFAGRREPLLAIAAEYQPVNDSIEISLGRLSTSLPINGMIEG